MSDNGSPDLILEPMNDTDELRIVTAYINPEFSRIRQKEKKIRITREMTQEIPRGNILNTSWEEKIIWKEY